MFSAVNLQYKRIDPQRIFCIVSAYHQHRISCDSAVILRLRIMQMSKSAVYQCRLCVDSAVIISMFCRVITDPFETSAVILHSISVLSVSILHVFCGISAYIQCSYYGLDWTVNLQGFSVLSAWILGVFCSVSAYIQGGFS